MFTSSYFFLISFLVIIPFVPKIIRDTRWGLLLLVFLLPFERIPSWNIPIEWGITLRLSSVVGIILIALFVKHILQNQELKDRVITFFKQPVVIGVIIYLAWLFISAIWAIDKEKTLYVGLFTSFTALLGFLFLIYFRRKDFPALEKILFWSSLVVVLFGLYQFMADSIGLSPFWTGLKSRYLKDILGFPRIQSTALEPLFLVNYLLIPFGYLSARYLTQTSRLANRSLAFILVAIMMVIVLTASRGGYIAILILILGLFIGLRKKINLSSGFKFITIIILAIFLAIGFALTSSQISYGNLSGTDSLLAHTSQAETDRGDKLSSREGTWKWAWQGFKEHSILGVGAGNFGPWMKEQGFSGRQRTVNNQVLEILVETGLIGGLIILFILATMLTNFVKALKKASQENRLWLVIFGSILLAILVQYQTFSTLYVIHFWVVIGLLLALIYQRKKEIKNA